MPANLVVQSLFANLSAYNLYFSTNYTRPLLPSLFNLIYTQFNINSLQSILTKLRVCRRFGLISTLNQILPLRIHNLPAYIILYPLNYWSALFHQSTSNKFIWSKFKLYSITNSYLAPILINLKNLPEWIYRICPGRDFNDISILFRFLTINLHSSWL